MCRRISRLRNCSFWKQKDIAGIFLYIYIITNILVCVFFFFLVFLTRQIYELATIDITVWGIICIPNLTSYLVSLRMECQDAPAHMSSKKEEFTQRTCVFVTRAGYACFLVILLTAIQP